MRSKPRRNASTASPCAWRVRAKRWGSAGTSSIALPSASPAAARLRHSLAIARSRIAARVDGAAVRLEALDPQRVLARGYALLVDRDDRPVTSVTRLAVGATVSARLSDGRAELTTTAIEPASPPR